MARPALVERVVDRLDQNGDVSQVVEYRFGKAGQTDAQGRPVNFADTLVGEGWATTKTAAERLAEENRRYDQWYAAITAPPPPVVPEDLDVTVGQITEQIRDLTRQRIDTEARRDEAEVKRRRIFAVQGGWSLTPGGPANATPAAGDVVINRRGLPAGLRIRGRVEANDTDTG